MTAAGLALSHSDGARRQSNLDFMCAYTKLVESRRATVTDAGLASDCE